MLKKILSNLDLIVGILLAFAIAVLDVMGVASTTVVTGAVLAILALLLALLLRLREAINAVRDQSEEQTAALSAVSQSLDGQRSASRLLMYDYPDLADLVEGASDILVVAGGSLRTTLGAYLHQFEVAVRSGARVRFACPNPDNEPLMRQLAISSGEEPNDVAGSIETNLLLVGRLSQGEAKAVEARVLEHGPTLGMIFIRTRLPPGGLPDLLFLKMLPFGRATRAPVLRLERETDARALDALHGSAEALWNSGRTWARRR